MVDTNVVLWKIREICRDPFPSRTPDMFQSVFERLCRLPGFEGPGVEPFKLAMEFYSANMPADGIDGWVFSVLSIAAAAWDIKIKGSEVNLDARVSGLIPVQYTRMIRRLEITAQMIVLQTGTPFKLK